MGLPVFGNCWRSKPIGLGITGQVISPPRFFCKMFPGQPLYQHLLWRVSDGYFAVHCYHHAAGDGSTGLLAMKGIFERYSKLFAGEKVDFRVDFPPILNCGGAIMKC